MPLRPSPVPVWRDSGGYAAFEPPPRPLTQVPMLRAALGHGVPEGPGAQREPSAVNGKERLVLGLEAEVALGSLGPQPSTEQVESLRGAGLRAPHSPRGPIPLPIGAGAQGFLKRLGRLA